MFIHVDGESPAVCAPCRIITPLFVGPLRNHHIQCEHVLCVTDIRRVDPFLQPRSTRSYWLKLSYGKLSARQEKESSKFKNTDLIKCNLDGIKGNIYKSSL